MIGTTSAAILVLIIVVLAGMLGAIVGGLTRWIFREPWSGKVIFSDTAVAAGLVIIAGYIIGTIDVAHHVWKSRVIVVVAIAIAGVVLRNLVRRVLRSQV